MKKNNWIWIPIIIFISYAAWGYMENSTIERLVSKTVDATVGEQNWDKKVTVTKYSLRRDAYEGKWYRKEAWDWLAFKTENGTWKVLISRDGFDCAELKTIPENHIDFFKNITVDQEGKPVCYSKNASEVTLCGKQFTINELKVDGVDIAKRISYLVNESYKNKISIDSDMCENVLNKAKSNQLTFDRTATTSYLPLDMELIRVFDDGNKEWVIEAWAYSPSKGKIYSTSAMDGNISNEIGSLK